jgi:hypothetical protein
MRTLLLATVAFGLSALALSRPAAAFDCDQTEYVYCEIVAASCNFDCGAYPCTCYCDHGLADCANGAGCDVPPPEDSCDLASQ